MNDVFPGNGRQPSAEEELRRLQRENATLRQERDFLKKAAVFFAKESRCSTPALPITGEFPVRLMCRVLAVSPAGFYAAQRRRLSPRTQRDQALRLQVRVVHAQTQRRYGAPRVHAELRAQVARSLWDLPEEAAKVLRHEAQKGIEEGGYSWSRVVGAYETALSGAAEPVQRGRRAN
jgi:hypothetical protein